MNRLLKNYQIMATVVGVNLIFVMTAWIAQMNTTPDSWWNRNESLVRVIDQIHGVLFMVLLVLIFMLTRRYAWSIGFMLSTMLLATIPLVSFWAERRASARVHRDDQSIRETQVQTGENTVTEPDPRVD